MRRGWRLEKHGSTADLKSADRTAVEKLAANAFRSRHARVACSVVGWSKRTSGTPCLTKGAAAPYDVVRGRFQPPAASSLQPPACSRGFTLIELLITVAIIAIMAGMILFAMFRAQEAAKAQKTKALITRLDAIIKSKWEAYKTRRVPVVIGPNKPPFVAAKMRLDALRDLMRMELPDRWSDIVEPPVAPFSGGPKIPRPAASRTYLRRYNRLPTPPSGEYAGAECLHLIVTATIAGDTDGADVFKPDNVADTDNDGMPEFIDGWGQPIKFLRWAPGFQFSELQMTVPLTQGVSGSGGGGTLNISGNGLSEIDGAYVGGAVIGIKRATTGNPPQPDMFGTTKVGRITGYQFMGSQTGSLTLANSSPAPVFSSHTGKIVIAPPDPFDPMRVHASSPPTASFALYPLIYSAGPDKCYSIMADQGTPGLSYPALKLDPFVAITENTVTALIGTARNNVDEKNYVPSGWTDNIHNHQLNLR